MPEENERERPSDSALRIEAELACLVEAVDIGVLLLDGAGRIRFANRCLADLIGLDPSDLAQLDDFAVLARASSDRFRDPRALARPSWEVFEHGDGVAREEWEMLRPPGKLIERVVRPVLDRSRRPMGWLEVYRDVTGRKLMQSKLLQTEKMAALGQLVSGIAHELNNPLTGIMGYAHLLLGHGLSRAQLSEAQKIYQEAERARRIVKNLSLFAREPKLERTPVDLNEVVERTLALRSYELKIENIAVELDLDPELPRTRADASQLQQVILNLLVNGEQAILEARSRGRIRLRTRQLSGKRLVLEVADDGPGVPREIASRIFDPFFTTKPPGLGTGLGLSIVYGIIHQHGGEIYLESRPGWGAVFVIELPLVEVTVDEFVPRSAARSVLSSAGRHILVVEDEPAVGHLIADVLREEQHEVEVVLDSQEGLNRVLQTDYDLVICDLRMPRLDGQAFYRALVSAGSRASQRMLFVTGDTLAARTAEFLEQAGLPYLAKPFLVEELKLAVNHVLGPAHSGASTAENGSTGGAGRKP